MEKHSTFIPIIWRYLIKNFFSIFFLSSLSFIALLLVSRFREIAKFAALSSSAAQTISFVLYQIPLILPLIIPLCCLLSGYITAQSLSKNSLITTLRSCAISLKSILIPIFFIAFLLALINFTIAGNISPKCKRLTKEMIQKESSINPLMLLQKTTLGKMKKHFVQITPAENPEYKNALILICNKNLQRTSLISMEQLYSHNGILHGKNFTSISYIPEKNTPLDSLIIENQSIIEIDAQEFIQKTEKKHLNLNEESLQLPILRLKSTHTTKSGSKALAEILSRSSLSLATIWLAILGFVFGVQSNRNTSRKASLLLALHTIFFISCYLAGNGTNNILKASFLACLAHLYLCIAIIRQMQNIEKGTT